jgi:hypothetical protein
MAVAIIKALYLFIRLLLIELFKLNFFSFIMCSYGGKFIRKTLTRQITDSIIAAILEGPGVDLVEGGGLPPVKGLRTGDGGKGQKRDDWSSHSLAPQRILKWRSTLGVAPLYLRGLQTVIKNR